MREIGGYIELDTYSLPMLHSSAIALNCGRNALAWILHARKIRKLWIPMFLCDSILRVCQREGIETAVYHIGRDLRPILDFELKDGDWFYFVNYYGQFGNAEIQEYVRQFHKRVIVDSAQSYFQPPITGVDTIYTCRKYFGVADGAFLYTDAATEESYPLDESYERMRFLLGRFERCASEFYSDYVNNNKIFAQEPIKQMSRLTRNLLHGIDYAKAEETRLRNYCLLHERLGRLNCLPVSQRAGTFMYPMMLEKGAEIRKKLQSEKIYIPTLWPSVFEFAVPGSTEYDLAERILPLPVDQRYNAETMEYLADFVERLI